MSNVSFSSSVFYQCRELSAIFIKSEIVVCKLFQFGSVKNMSFGKGLRHEYQQFTLFLSCCQKQTSYFAQKPELNKLGQDGFENSKARKENAGNQHFCRAPLGLARHNCYNYSSVYVHALSVHV